MDLLNFVLGSYEHIMLIVNFVCFGCVCFCVVVLFVALLISRMDWWYRRVVTGALIGLIALLVIHFWLQGEVGISLIVPPLDAPYFEDFMHVIQYIVTLSVVGSGAYVFAAAALRLVDDYQFGKAFVSGIFYLILMFFIHNYFVGNFGVYLIFPPNLW